MDDDSFVNGIRHIINHEIDKSVDVWRAEFKAAQEERNKMQSDWQEEKKKTSELQAERDHLEDLIEEVREEAAEIKRDFKSDIDLKAENERLKECITKLKLLSGVNQDNDAMWLIDQALSEDKDDGLE